MEVKKTSKKTLVASGLAVAVSVALLAGTTFAWFTDSVVNKGNSIQSGTLGITAEAYEVDDNKDTYTIGGLNGGKPFGFEDTANDLENEDYHVIQENNWEPGQSNAKLLKVTNNGSLAAKIKLQAAVADSGLENALWFDFIKVEDGEAVGQFTKRPMSQLADFVSTMDNTILNAKESLEFILAYGMNEEAGNEYQDKGYSADVSIVATQATVEKDGFGNDQYDENATYPVASLDEFKDALDKAEAGDVISMSDDITVSETINVTKDITIQGNGATFAAPANETSSYAINVASTSATIEGCTFTNGVGVHLQPGAGDVVISGCTFSGGKKSVYVNGGNTGSVVIENCTISKSLNIEGANNTAKDVTVRNNVFKGYSDGTLTLAGNLENVEICNNQFQGQTDIRVYNQGGFAPNFTNVTAHDNTYAKNALIQFDNEADKDQITESNNTKA